MSHLPGRVSGRALVAFLAAVAVVPWLLPNQYLVHVVVLAGIYVILAVGLNLVMGYAGQVSLGHAGFYGLGAYVSAVLSVRYGLSPWLGMAIAAVATGAVAYVVGIPTLRLKSYYLGMATLGIGAVLHLAFVQLPASPAARPGSRASSRGISARSASRRPRSTTSSSGPSRRPGSGSRAISSTGASAACCARSARARRRRRPWASTPRRRSARVFVLSAVYASVAGSLYAHYITVISPEIYSFLFSVVLVLMVAIGGIGLYWGAVVGAVLLTVLPEALRRFGDWEVPLYGLALIAVILFMPRGIAGVFARDRRSGALAGAAAPSPHRSRPRLSPASARRASSARAPAGPCSRSAA